jgi:VWFA-related protein
MKLAITLLVLTATFAPAQTQVPTVRTATAGVLIDVTVLDKDGRPVTDLKAEDFEVSEDGKAQKIVSATLMRSGVPSPVAGSAADAIARAPASSTTAGSASTTMPNVPPATTPTVTAILFESLSADTRSYAARAAAELVSTLAPPNEYAGVFLGGLGFATLQPFTNRREDVRQALNRVAVSALNDLLVDAEQSRVSSRIQGLDPSTPVTPGAESGRGYTTIGERDKLLHGKDPDSKLREMEYRMEEGYTRMLAELEGDAALAGLRTTVQGLAAMPGRKSILYFTEALPITSRLKSHFDALIGEANRANVTVYPVDAAGLRLHSKEAEVGRNVNLAGAQGVGDAQRENGAWTKELEKQEEMLSSRPASVLGRLANETGGFLIDNTNDLGKGVTRMQVERTTYYLLGYQPTNTAMDGKFRRVTVKVKRGKYTVRARPGYLAPM